MTPPVIGLRLVAGVVLIPANGFFVATEFDAPALERAWETTQDLEIHPTSR